jgi:hypothetical protein
MEASVTGRIVRYCALWCSVQWVATAAQTGDIGIYHWGGQAQVSMSDGVQRIAALGGRVARVVFSPKYYSDYRGVPTCYANFSLAVLAREPDVERALDTPQIRTFMLTVYDGATFGDCRTHKYLNVNFYTPKNMVAVKREYSDFVLHLFGRHAGTERQFILSNWEGDNDVYCGAAFAYASDPSFRKHCDDNYPLLYDGNTDPAQSLEGMRLWLEARQEGIADGIARAAAAGLSGVTIVHAPEVNIVRTLEDHGFRSVLRDVLPRLRPDYVSYSAYESLNTERPADAIIDDLGTVRALSGTPHVIIGEAGYARTRADTASLLETALRSAFGAGVRHIMVWNLSDDTHGGEFGVLDARGNLTEVGVVLTKFFRDAGAEN